MLYLLCKNMDVMARCELLDQGYGVPLGTTSGWPKNPVQDGDAKPCGREGHRQSRRRSSYCETSFHHSNMRCVLRNTGTRGNSHKPSPAWQRPRRVVVAVM